ncbi:MAG: hydrogen gas-evolving membrane-bound hydrogenase subunit E [Eubacteriales bacterium]
MAKDSKFFNFNEKVSLKARLLLFIYDFSNGDIDLTAQPKEVVKRRETPYQEPTIDQRFRSWHSAKAQGLFKGMYNVASTAICLGVISLLLVTVSYLPPHGDPTNPVHNEVSERYLEQGTVETGALNAVAGMILDYRAFDTFGESAVLFAAAISALMFLQNPPDKKGLGKINPEYKPMTPDPIVKVVAKYLIPFLMIFGVYIVLNGHNSPGGGFAGGSIMGSSLILYSTAYSYEVVRPVLSEKFIKKVISNSMTFYAIAKGYSFFTGANHIPTGIPLGTVGNIISAGLILPLNMAIAAIVTCTMYTFYSLFSKGAI